MTMRPLTWLLGVACCIGCCLLSGTSAELFEPKGSENLDPLFKFEQPIRVFDVPFPSGTFVYANVPNGRISIGDRSAEYLSNAAMSAAVHLLQPFEIKSKDIAAGGRYYYTSITDLPLANMSELVRANFFRTANFTATGGHLFTWEDLYEASATSARFTFQVALLYDASSLYAIFNYHAVPSAKFKDPIISGFSRRNSVDSVSLPFTEDSTQLLGNASGTGDRKPGRFIYRVDVWPPVRGGCLSEDPPQPQDRRLASTLLQDSVLGGSLAVVSGRCPEPGQTAACQVRVGDHLLSDRPASRHGTAFWACEVPPSLRVGPATLALSVASQPQSQAYSTDFSYVSPDHPGVARILLAESADSWMQTQSASLMISYNATEALNGSLKLQVIGYSEAGLDQLGRPDDFKRLTKVLLEIPASSSGSMNLATVRCPAGNSDCESYHVGFLRIVDNSTPAHSIKSRIIPLGWFVHPYYADKSSPSWAAEKCKSWLSANPEQVLPELRRLACPGRLNTTLANSGLFLPATYCPTLAGGCEAATPKQRCFVSRPRTSAAFPGVPAALCCYGDSEDLLFQETREESGTATQQGSSSFRSHPFGLLQRSTQALLPGQVSYLSHWYWDLLPQLYCCRWATGGLCHLQFMQGRPTPRPSVYAAGRSAFMIGDPHATSYSGRPFLFNGVGEYWLLQSKNFTVQARFQMLPQVSQNASFLTGLAVRAGGVNIAEVSGRDGRPVVQRRRQDSKPQQSVAVNLAAGDVFPLDAGLTVQLAAADRLMLQLASDQGSVGIVLKSVLVAGNLTYLDMFLTLSDSMKAETRGLLGQWTDDLTKEFRDIRDGVTAYDSSNWRQFHTDFCAKNQLSSSTESLFGYAAFSNRDLGYTKLNLDASRDFTSPVYALPATPHPREGDVCGTGADALDCLFDLRVTRSSEVGAATAANGRLFRALRAAESENASFCDVPAIPGIAISRPPAVGSSLSIRCAPPLVASGQARDIVCTRLASGAAAWVPDPAGLGVQCGPEVLALKQGNVGLIVGIVVPLIVLLLVGIVLIVCLVRRSRTGKQPDSRMEGSPQPKSQQVPMPQPSVTRPGTNDQVMSKSGGQHFPVEDGRRNPKAVQMQMQQQQQHPQTAGGYSGVATAEAPVPAQRHAQPQNQPQNQPEYQPQNQPEYQPHYHPHQHHPHQHQLTKQPKASHSEVV